MDKKIVYIKVLKAIKDILPVIIDNYDFISKEEGPTKKFRLLKRNFSVEEKREKLAKKYSKTVRLIGHLSAALDTEDLDQFSKNIDYVIALSILWKISREDKNAKIN
jgi:hypothetical protein